MKAPLPVTVTGELMKTLVAHEKSEKTLNVILPKGLDPARPETVAVSVAVTGVDPVGVRVTGV